LPTCLHLAKPLRTAWALKKKRGPRQAV